MKLEFIEIKLNSLGEDGFRIDLSEYVSEIELFIAEPVDQDHGESEVLITRKDGSIQRIFLRACLYIMYKPKCDR